MNQNSLEEKKLDKLKLNQQTVSQCFPRMFCLHPNEPHNHDWRNMLGSIRREALGIRQASNLVCSGVLYCSWVLQLLYYI